MDVCRFIGRKKQLEVLRREFQRYDLVLIHGMKAIGKSSLVKHFCKDLKCRIVWIDLRNTTQPDHLLQSLTFEFLGDLVAIDNFDEMLKSIEHNIKEMNTELLIVFDNAEDALSPGTMDFAIETFKSLCAMDEVSIIITCTTNIDLNGVNMMALPVNPLSCAESEELLLSNCRTLKNSEIINEIVELCAGVPLAIVMTAAELDEGILTPGEMCELLRQSRLQILSQTDYTVEERIGPMYVGFLERLAENLRDKLAIVNYIPGSFNEQETMGLLDTSAEEALETLSRSSQRNLLLYDARIQRYDIHGILRDCISQYIAIKDLPKIRKRFCKTFTNVVQHLEEIFPSDKFSEALCRINLEQQNIRKLFYDVMYCQEDSYYVFVHLAATSLFQEGILFTSVEAYETGFLFYEKCLKKTQEFKNDLDESKVLTGYARVITNIKANYSSGEEKFRKALKLRECHPEEDYFLALLFQGLGWNLGSQGKYVEGLVFLKKALEMEERLGMRYDHLILQTLQSLAIFYMHIGNIVEGEVLQLETLKRRLHVIGTEEHPYIGSIMNNLGEMYEKKGETDRAVEYYKRGLDIKIRTKAHFKAILASESNLANSLSATGNLQGALDILKNSIDRLDIFPDLFQDKKSEIYDAMGRAHLQNNNPREASKAFQEAIDLRRQSSLKDHTIIALSCRYAKSLSDIGENDKTVNVLTEALTLKHILIENVPTSLVIVECYDKILGALFRLKRFDEMLDVYNDGRAELLRLVKVYEDQSDFIGREKILAYLRKYDQQYFDYCSSAVRKEKICNETFTDFKFVCTLFGCKIFCYILLFHLLKLKHW